MPNDDDFTNASAEDLLVVPAWCDPKSRAFVWDAGTIQVGILTIGGDDLAYATSEGLMFAVKLNQIQVHWSRFRHLIRSCDLDTPQGSYRLYFCRPLPGAPRVREDQITTITDALRSYRDIAQFIGDKLGTAVTLGSIIGDLVALPGEFTDQRIGQHNGDAVRKRLSR